VPTRNVTTRKAPTRKAPTRKVTPPTPPRDATEPSAPPFPARRAMESGDRGEHVSTAQQRLTALGLYDGKVSGVYGYAMVRAVRRLQGASDLRPSGVIDAATWAALYR